MNAIESLKNKLKNKEKIFSTMLSNAGFTGFPEYYKMTGLDFLVMDLEHGAFCPENIGDFAHMCRVHDLPVIARVQDCEYHCISKTLDMGCDGVLIPRTETMEQVETAISSMRVHPVGKKGVGGRALIRKGEDIYDINKNRLLFLQIESKKGIDLLDQMLKKYSDEIAGIIIGPCDLAVSLGCGLNDTHEKVNECIRETIAICKNNNKSIGMFMDDEKVAKTWHDEGMNIFWIGNEISVLLETLSRYKNSVDNF